MKKKKKADKSITRWQNRNNRKWNTYFLKKNKKTDSSTESKSSRGF